jgi:hypothetical protein
MIRLPSYMRPCDFDAVDEFLTDDMDFFAPEPDVIAELAAEAEQPELNFEGESR